MRKLALLATAVLAAMALSATTANAQGPVEVIDTSTNESCTYSLNSHCFVEDLDIDVNVYRTDIAAGWNCDYVADLKVYGDGYFDFVSLSGGTGCGMTACGGVWPGATYSIGEQQDSFEGYTQLCIADGGNNHHIYVPLEITEADGDVSFDGTTNYQPNVQVSVSAETEGGSGIDIQPLVE